MDMTTCMPGSTGSASYEKCRFCRVEILSDDVASIMAHLNTHWKQLNLNLEHPPASPPQACSFETLLDSRLSGNPALSATDLSDPLDDDGFPYLYSPQTEPSNLTVTAAGGRCSPLNLTGRPKVTSCPPQSNSHPAHLNIPPAIQYQSPLSSNLDHFSTPQCVDLSMTSVHPNVTHGYSSNLTTGSLNTMMSGENCTPMQSQPLQDFPLDMMTNNYQPELMGNFPPLSLGNHQSQSSLNQINGSCCDINISPSDAMYCDDRRGKKRQGAEDLRCPLCSRTFYTKAFCDEHVAAHMNELNDCYSGNPMSANQPINAMTTNCVMSSANPVVNQTLVKPYKCLVCDLEFNRKEELHRHGEVHDAHKLCTCDTCGIRVSNLSALNRHKRAHAGHKPHACTLCGKRFLQRCDLVRHAIVHTRAARRIVCHECHLVFSTQVALDAHTCSVTAPLKCSICGDSFIDKVSYSYHMWRHTKNPIYVPVCENISLPCEPKSKC